jgi:hypothetical protein
MEEQLLFAIRQADDFIEDTIGYMRDAKKLQRDAEPGSKKFRELEEEIESLGQLIIAAIEDNIRKANAIRKMYGAPGLELDVAGQRIHDLANDHFYSLEHRIETIVLPPIMPMIESYRRNRKFGARRR